MMGFFKALRNYVMPTLGLPCPTGWFKGPSGKCYKLPSDAAPPRAASHREEMRQRVQHASRRGFQSRGAGPSDDAGDGLDDANARMSKAIWGAGATPTYRCIQRDANGKCTKWE